MPDPNDFYHKDMALPEPLAAEEPAIALPRKKGCTVLAWLVIFILVGLMIARSFHGEEESGKQDRLQEIVFEMQARALVGQANSFLPIDPKELYEQAKVLENGSWGQRLKFIVLAGELAGPKEAWNKTLDLQTAMDFMEEKTKVPAPTAQDKQVALLLEKLYSAYVSGDFQAVSLTKEDRAFLRQSLGWFGKLALHPRAKGNVPPLLAAPGEAVPVIARHQDQIEATARSAVLDPALITFGVILGALVSGCFLSFVGFVGLIIFVILLAKRQLTCGLATGSNHGGIYAETFALFLLFFLGLSLLFQLLPEGLSPLMKTSLVALGSLAVVGWPVLRGISWVQVRQDIGWTLGRSPALEPVLGVACYVLALPIVIFGLIMTLVLMALRNQLDGFGLGGLAHNQPIHPIVEFIVHGSDLDRLLVFFDACILAPILEETMFRGFLYRHLRELSRRWSWLVSVLLSGTIVSFIFAAIHPQGLIAVPVLMAAAYGFTIAREWRGSLIPSMVGHALNNAVVLLFLMLMSGE